MRIIRRRPVFVVLILSIFALVPGVLAHLTVPAGLHDTGIEMAPGEVLTFTLKDPGTCSAEINALVIDSSIADITPTGPVTAVELDFTVTAKKAGTTSIKLSWVGSDFPDGFCNEKVDDFRIPLSVVPLESLPPIFQPILPKNGRVGSTITLPIRATSQIPDSGVSIEAGQLPSGANFDPESGFLTFQPTEEQIGFTGVTLVASDDSDPSLSSSQEIFFSVSPSSTFEFNLLGNGNDGFQLDGLSGDPVTVFRSIDLQGWDPLGIWTEPDEIIIPPPDVPEEGSFFFQARTGLPPRYVDSDSESFLFEQPLPEGFSDQSRLFFGFSEDPSSGPPQLVDMDLAPQGDLFSTDLSSDLIPQDGTLFWFIQGENDTSCLFSQELIHVEELPANTPPTIGVIADQTIARDGALSPQSFTVLDSETPASLLRVTGTSSNNALVSNANILFSGTGSIRRVAVFPTAGETGTATITMTVTDQGGLTASTSFTVNVVAGTPPTISNIPSHSTQVNAGTGAIPFTVEDAETPATELTVTATSSNQVLLPNANVFLGGSGSSRTVSLVPAENQLGQATITLTVSDGTHSASTSFALNVTTQVQVDDADFNGDGIADVLSQDGEGKVAVLLMDGENGATSVPLNPSHPGNKNWRIVGAADFNGDGQTDILWQHADGTVALWFMDGVNLVSAQLLNPSQPDDSMWKVTAVGDFNSDGDPDMIFQHEDGTLGVWIMDGENLEQARLLEPSGPSDPKWRVVASGDLNGDRETDLIFQHEDGMLAAWLMDGTTLITSTLLGTGVNPGGRVAGSADHDSDGQTDLLFQLPDGTTAVSLLEGTDLKSTHTVTTSTMGSNTKLIGP